MPRSKLLFALLLGSACWHDAPLPPDPGSRTQSSTEETIASNITPQNKPNCPPAVTLTGDKNNEIYLGVDNPMSLAVVGISPSDIQIEVRGDAVLKSSGRTQFIVKGTRMGTTTISVSAQGVTLGEWEYKVKRIPDPKSRIGGLMGGKVSREFLSEQLGLYAQIEWREIHGACQVNGYKVTHLRPGELPSEIVNLGGAYTEAAQRLIGRARRDDYYLFTDVRARCPGDAGPRHLNDLVFRIQ